MNEELITYNNMWFGAPDPQRWIVEEEEEFEDRISCSNKTFRKAVVIKIPRKS